MKIIRNGSYAAITEGLEQYFTGEGRLDYLVTPEHPSQVSIAHVSFAPKARTTWHTHPIGQTLIVTFGKGYIQREGEEKELIQAGDVVWIAPHEKHWHGATQMTAMSHIAIQEKDANGENVVWMEAVSDADYLAKRGTL
jgi:quercetin dioxygenase-like cupin family protein